jgi:hypothetical protein
MKRPFKSLEEQKQIFNDVGAEGNWNIICDVDEFFCDGDINRLRNAIHRHPMASEFIFTFLHYYRTFNHIRDFGQEWILSHQRCVRWRPLSRYHSHPVLSLADGTCSYFDPRMQPLRFMTNILIHHYGHAKPIADHDNKRKFYQSELKQYPAGPGQNASQAFDEKFREFATGTESLNTVLRYDGPQPSIMARHPLAMVNYEPYLEPAKAAQIRHWRQSDFYKLWPNLPTIPQWMLNWPWANARMQPFYNGIEV